MSSLSQVQRRVRYWEDNWLLGAALYHEALKAAGLPAPAFEWSQEWHPDDDAPEKSDTTITVHLIPLEAMANEREP